VSTGASQFGDKLAEPLGEGNTTALDADQGEIRASIAFFNDLVGQADEVRSISDADIRRP